MFLFIIGAISLSYYLLKFIWEIIKTQRYNLDIQSKYGKDCWAVITGATDGIGKAYVQLLVKQNVNICMIVRNQEKAQQLVNSFSNTKSKFRIVIADFNNCTQIDFFDKIYNQIKDLDIGLLINNVGVSFPEKEFINFTDEECREMITVNCYPVVWLTKKLIVQMQKRPKSGIINVASFAACMIVPYMSLYKATKAFVDFFSKAINQEYSNIDILSHQPLLVSTPMTQYTTEHGSISAEKCALGGLQRLGLDDGTPGYWQHRLQGYLIKCIPEGLLKKLVKQELKKKL